MSSVYGVSRRAGRAGARTACPSTSTVGHDRRDAIGVELDRAAAVGDGGDDLQRRPQPDARETARSAWRPRSSASCTSPGKSDRHVEVDERRVAATTAASTTSPPGRRRRARRAPPCWRRADERGVAERVARAVDAGRLAVPDADDAVVAASAERRPRAAMPITAVAASSSLRPGWSTTRSSAATRPIAGCELPVEAGERRALVAGDERRRVQTRRGDRRGAGRAAARASAWLPDRNTRPSSRR